MKTPILQEHLIKAHHDTQFVISELRDAHRVNRNKFEQSEIIKMIRELRIIENSINLMLLEDDEE